MSDPNPADPFADMSEREAKKSDLWPQIELELTTDKDPFMIEVDLHFRGEVDVGLVAAEMDADAVAHIVMERVKLDVSEWLAVMRHKLAQTLKAPP